MRVRYKLLFKLVSSQNVLNMTEIPITITQRSRSPVQLGLSAAQY
jgi:hypothetical protein